MVAAALSVGCRTGGVAERYGKTFYLDGAGNWGYGADGISRGLAAAGYSGDVEEYVWTTSFNPLVDQLNIVAAKFRSEALARKITDYVHRYPENTVNIVALSAGSGVATWAIEALPDGVGIDNLILLGSSLSHDYDMSEALSHMSGTIYVYYSEHDVVLQKVRVIGTIDGKRGVDSVGYSGLVPPRDLENRVVNTGWTRDWLRYGWTGAHADCTNAQFVRYELAKVIVAHQGVAHVKHGIVSIATGSSASQGR